MSPGRRGFTIAEMLVVVMLSALILVGLTAIFGTGMRQQLAGMRKTVIQNRALIAMRALQSQMEQATAIVSPATGAGAVDLVIGGINVDPNPDPAVPVANWAQLANLPGGRRWFAFCVADNDKCPVAEGYDKPCLWFYSQAGWPPPAAGAVTCGDAVGTADRLVLAGPIAAVGSTANPPAAPTPFTRPLNNIVTANFDVIRFGNVQASTQLRSEDIRASVNLSMRLRMSN